MKTFFYMLFGVIFTAGFILGAMAPWFWGVIKPAIHSLTS